MRLPVLPTGGLEVVGWRRVASGGREARWV